MLRQVEKDCSKQGGQQRSLLRSSSGAKDQIERRTNESQQTNERNAKKFQVERSYTTRNMKPAKPLARTHARTHTTKKQNKLSSSSTQTHTLARTYAHAHEVVLLQGPATIEALAQLISISKLFHLLLLPLIQSWTTFFRAVYETFP